MIDGVVPGLIFKGGYIGFSGTTGYYSSQPHIETVLKVINTTTTLERKIGYRRSRSPQAPEKIRKSTTFRRSH